jgi:phosphoglycolate phosphatase
MIRAVVFDFDGTLTELTLNFTDLRREVELIAGKYVSPDAVRRLDGLYIIEMIYEVERMAGEAGAVFREEAFTRLRDLETEAADGKEVYPYTRDVLQSLRRRGIKIGVMTRSCIGALKTVFPDLDVYVDAVVTREDIREVKPDPSHVRAVLEALDIDPSQALLVGDHPTDVLAGETLSVRTAGVLTGRTTRSEFEEAGADHVLADIRDVVRIVNVGV